MLLQNRHNRMTSNTDAIAVNELLKEYLKTRKHTEALCAPLTIEDYTPQSAIFASPPKWHLAHVTWFIEEMILKKEIEGYQVFDPEFSFLFNSYYNSLGQRIARDQRGLMTRPSVERVYAYRKYVDEHMQAVLEKGCSDRATELTILAINHEQQHQELLITDLKYTFSHNPIHPKYSDQAKIADHNTDNGWHKVEAGLYPIGHQGDGFHFDNELGQHQVYLEEFQIAKHLVTNGDYIKFIEDGGYEKAGLWLDEGWAWVNANKITRPLYWHQKDGEWLHYTLGGMLPIDQDAILSHISFYEAAAYAMWSGHRLPTEFEWETAADSFNWGKRWEWTYSAYLPYPRFSIQPGAVGEYNGKFMVNQMVLRGASVATAEGHSRKTYRNFFHPQYQWQFTGLRLVKR